MKKINLCFKVHLPYKLRKYRFFDIGNEHYYYADFENRLAVKDLTDDCYVPANKVLMQLIKTLGSQFRVTFSISGLALQMFREFCPGVLDSFRKLAETGQADFLAETHSHSLASLYNRKTFEHEVRYHSNLMRSYIGVMPRIFANTELIYSDDIAGIVADMGYKGILTEGAKHILSWKSPNFMYYAAENPKLKVLLNNYMLSDALQGILAGENLQATDMVHRFIEQLLQVGQKDQVITLYLDYASFHKQVAGEQALDFLWHFPFAVLKQGKFEFSSPVAVRKQIWPVAGFRAKHPISRVDEERDVTAWLGNEMQQEAFQKLYALAEKTPRISDGWIQRDWERLQASEHFYFMRTKYTPERRCLKRQNPYPGPYEAFINYMNVLNDFTLRVDEKLGQKNDNKSFSDLIAYHEAELKRLRTQASFS